MKPFACFLTFLLFFSLLGACTTRPTAKTFTAEKKEKIDPQLPAGYLLLQKIKLDTDNDNQVEIVLFGHKGNRLLLLVFDTTPEQGWVQHTLSDYEFNPGPENSAGDLVCIVHSDWIGWGLPNSEPYEIFIWDGKRYLHPRFLM